MDATIVVHIRNEPKQFTVSAGSRELPDVSQGLIDELQALGGVAWVQRSYGETWLDISFDEMSPLRTNEALNFIRKALEKRGLKFEQAKPARLRTGRSS